MKKEFEHKKTEECNLCKKEVNTETEDWTTVIDYRGENQMSVKFYHTSCLKDLIKGQGKVIQRNFMDKIGKVIKSVSKNFSVDDTQTQKVLGG